MLLNNIRYIKLKLAVKNLLILYCLNYLFLLSILIVNITIKTLEIDILSLILF